MLEEAKRKFFVFLSWSYYVLKAEKMDRKKNIKKKSQNVSPRIYTVYKTKQTFSKIILLKLQ